MAPSPTLTTAPLVDTDATITTTTTGTTATASTGIAGIAVTAAVHPPVHHHFSQGGSFARKVSSRNSRRAATVGTPGEVEKEFAECYDMAQVERVTTILLKMIEMEKTAAQTGSRAGTTKVRPSFLLSCNFQRQFFNVNLNLQIPTHIHSTSTSNSYNFNFQRHSTSTPPSFLQGDAGGKIKKQLDRPGAGVRNREAAALQGAYCVCRTGKS